MTPPNILGTFLYTNALFHISYVKMSKLSIILTRSSFLGEKKNQQNIQ